jgi:kumamolisin
MGSQRLSLQVHLRLRHFAELQAAIGELSDPRSPGFQRFLSPVQLTARYGPTEAELRTVERYLWSAGITITSVSPQRNMIDATAAVSVADRAFGVQIQRWRGTNGSSFYSPATNPALPASVAPLVLAISGLDNAARLEPDTTTCTTTPAGGRPSGTCSEPAGVNNLGYNPAQLQKAYGLTRLAGSGLCGTNVKCNGSGQYVGILEFQSSWDPANETAFDTQYGLNVPSPSATAFCYPKSPCPIAIDTSDLGAVGEADLDVEVAHAIAPGARVLVYQTTSDMLSGLGNLLATMLNGKAIATTSSISYGACESDVGSSQAQAMDQQFALLAMRGQVVFAASGDTGRYCLGTTQVEPAYPASDPMVTSVGGTNLLLNSDNSYAYEYAWSESGGGASTYTWNTRPSWQAGPGVPTGTQRLVPDVSAIAFCSLTTGCSGNSGYDYDVTGPGTSYPNAALGFSERTYCPGPTQCWVSNGGTSLASPLWASVAAVYNQYAESAGKIPFNANVSAQLYNLAFRPHLHPRALTDITYKAENSADLFQNAGSGWDGATGAGSPQAYTMVSDLPGITVDPTAGPPGATVTISGSAFRPGETVNVTDTTGSPAAICSATAIPGGNFSCTGTIPASASYQLQRIMATGITSGGQATVFFDVATATRAPLPANAAADPFADLASVACPATTACVAAGTYNDKSSGTQGVLTAGSGTSWTATQAPLPSDAAPNPNVDLRSVACAAATSCVAVGGYGDSAGNFHGLLVTGSGTSWTATQAPLPANASTSPSADLQSVTCPSTTACVATGYYTDTSGAQQGLLVTGSGNSWTATEAPLPANASTHYPNADLSSVACSSTTSCIAVGTYSNGGSNGLLVTGWGSSWTATEAPVPADAYKADPFADLSSVTCAAATSCVAVGTYESSRVQDQALLETGSGTSWAAKEAPLPRDANRDLSSGFSSVACPSKSSCVATGNYGVYNGYLPGLLETGSGTSWTATEAPAPGGGSTSADLPSVACPSTSSCVAAGSYSNPVSGLLETGSGTSWTGATPPLPSGGDYSFLGSNACPTTGACVAAGYYTGSSGNQYGLLIATAPG